MNYSEIVNKIKFLFSGEQAEQAFVDIKTVDGLILRVDGEIAVGAKVQQIAEDGTLAEIADSEVSIEGGSILVIAGGVITAIKNDKTYVDPATGEQVANLEQVQPEEMSTEELAAEEIPATEPVTPEEVVPEMDIPAEIEGIKTEIEGIKEVIMQMVEAIQSLTTSNSEMSKAVEEYSKTAAVSTSIKEVSKFQKTNTTPVDTKNMTWAQKINYLKNK